VRIVEREVALGDVAAIALSGSMPLGAPPEGFARIASIAGGARVPVVADTYGPALAAVLAERPALVKINADEATETTGVAVTDAASAALAGQVLLDAGAATAVVTPGCRQGGRRDGDRVTLEPRRSAGAIRSGAAMLPGRHGRRIARGDDIVEAARLGPRPGSRTRSYPAQASRSDAVEPIRQACLQGRGTVTSDVRMSCAGRGWRPEAGRRCRMRPRRTFVVAAALASSRPTLALAAVSAAHR
jgi:hypothetical protein